ncbi:MAG: PAS domain S-box protein [Candidatus Magasanikbacteria bacterium]|nr:PAS domain S-box protein [Candidatus Magasanikbacteria bacterium]
MNTSFLYEHRCKCGKLLLKGIFFDGLLEIKCKKCGIFNSIGSIKLADDATHYLMIIDDRGIITNVSDSACKILGYAYGELIGKNIIQICPVMPEEISKKFFGPESLLKEGRFFQLDTIHKSKDGRNIPVSVFFKAYRPTEKGEYILISTSIRDAKIDENNLGENGEKFLDNACDYYFRIDKNGVGEYVSPSVETLFGFKPEMVIGKNYFDFLPEEARVEAKKTFDNFCTRELPYRVVRVGGNNAQGKPVESEQYFTPNFDDSGKFVGYHVLGWLPKNP